MRYRDTVVASLEELKDKVLSDVSLLNGEEAITFTTVEGEKYFLFHWQECCESVTIESIEGNLNDLVGHPILLSEVITNNENPKDECTSYFTWSFYKFATIKGSVVIRWYGESNGYYSETVDFRKEYKSEDIES